MKRSSCLFLIMLISKISICQLVVSLDFSNVEQTVAFFKKSNPTKEDIDNLVATEGVRSIIKKIRSNDSIARVVLQKVSQGVKTSGKENDFQYSFIKEHLQELEDFAVHIQTNRKVILDSINSLSVYLPAGKKIPVKVCFLAGGYSAGFTLSDDNMFYIGMHQYKNDLTGIVNTCQHELFHNIQALSYDRTTVMKKLQEVSAFPALYAYYIGLNIFVEGTAEFIADIDKMDITTPYMSRQAEHANVNRYRMRENFYLVEKLLMDAYVNNEKIDADLSYNILFDWNWNNPGYQVGKLMARSLVKENGPMVIKKYLSSDPMIFIRDYIKLSRTNKADLPYTFSDEFEKMIDAVVAKVESLQL